MALRNFAKYRLVSRPGITAIIINGKMLLLLKRRNIPIILNPGIWSFLTGARDKNENYLHTAYREIREEVNLKEHELRPLGRTLVYLKDDKKRIRWHNQLFFFSSRTSRIRLDLENSAYRWAPFKDVVNHVNYTNVFINEQPILSKIKRFLDAKGAGNKKGKKGP